MNNPHYEKALRNADHFSTGVYDSAEEQMVGLQIAHTYALLALAHEQRTANMIAYQSLDRGARVLPPTGHAAEIETRLGVAK